MNKKRLSRIEFVTDSMTPDLFGKDHNNLSTPFSRVSERALNIGSEIPYGVVPLDACTNAMPKVDTR